MFTHLLLFEDDFVKSFSLFWRNLKRFVKTLKIYQLSEVVHENSNSARLKQQSFESKWRAFSIARWVIRRPKFSPPRPTWDNSENPAKSPNDAWASLTTIKGRFVFRLRYFYFSLRTRDDNLIRDGFEIKVDLGDVLFFQRSSASRDIPQPTHLHKLKPTEFLR